MRLRCPLCGEGKLFRGWLRMNAECPHCGLKFEREPGFFLGSIYINYGLTALIAAITYPVLLFQWQVPETPLLLGAVAFTVPSRTLCPLAMSVRCKERTPPRDSTA